MARIKVGREHMCQVYGDNTFPVKVRVIAAHSRMTLAGVRRPFYDVTWVRSDGSVRTQFDRPTAVG